MKQNNVCTTVHVHNSPREASVAPHSAVQSCEKENILHQKFIMGTIYGIKIDIIGDGIDTVYTLHCTYAPLYASD